ncbi:MAG: site-specific integrase [Candidatus Onthoplasma sp.]
MKYKGIAIHMNKNCNTWYTRFRKDGKQHYISARTQKECYDKLKCVLSNTEITKIDKSKNITLKNWYLEWLKLYKMNKVKQSTIEDYNSSLKNIKSLMEQQIKTITITQIIESLNKIQAERQKQKVYELLKMIFQKAYIHEIISKNIMDLVERPEHTKQNGRALTHKEEEKLILECQNYKYGDIFLIALYQGLRKGEVLGITDKDIDFENETLSINKAINRHNKFDTTKNNFSIRTMPMFAKTKQILLNYKNMKGRIFNLSYHRVDDKAHELSQKLGFYFSLKFMRYTFITRCEENGIPESVVQGWVGHKLGSKITKSVYTKPNAEDNYKYINILNDSKFYSNSTHEKKMTNFLPTTYRN